MNNSRFSSLVYRIIGKPEAWHNDYIDVMHEILDETDSFDDPENFSELAFGDQIVSRLRESNETLEAFNTLLDKSRFKMIILDDDYVPIYHNKNAECLMASVLCPQDNTKLTQSLLKEIKATPKVSEQNSKNVLQAINFFTSGQKEKQQLYLRSIQSQLDLNSPPRIFHLLLVLDQSREENELNPDLIAKFELTEKEQLVLRNLIHGKSIKDIATEIFISENTVKTHMKSLFRKTNTNSQASIVRLILTHESQILDSYFDTGSSYAEQTTNSTDKEVVLKDGNRIVYREYGPENGRPLIVCHNGYGCRLTIPNNYEEICERTNRRVIIPDRPGVGRTPYIKKHPEGWFSRLGEFIDLLGIDRYDILGNVFGAQISIGYALQADDRLERLIITSPVIVNTRKDADYLTGILSPVTRLVRASRAFAREIYELWLKSVTLNLDKHYRSMLETSVGSAEKELFEKNNTIDSIVDGFKEASRLSFEGISHEMVYCTTPLKSDLSTIKAKVDIWYGTEDNRISLEGAENISKQIPNSTLHVREGYSEHIYFALFEEIIAYRK